MSTEDPKAQVLIHSMWEDCVEMELAGPAAPFEKWLGMLAAPVLEVRSMAMGRIDG